MAPVPRFGPIFRLKSHQWHQIATNQSTICRYGLHKDALARGRLHEYFVQVLAVVGHLQQMTLHHCLVAEAIPYYTLNLSG